MYAAAGQGRVSASPKSLPCIRSMPQAHSSSASDSLSTHSATVLRPNARARSIRARTK